RTSDTTIAGRRRTSTSSLPTNAKTRVRIARRIMCRPGSFVRLGLATRLFAGRRACILVASDERGEHLVERDAHLARGRNRTAGIGRGFDELGRRAAGIRD